MQFAARHPLLLPALLLAATVLPAETPASSSTPDYTQFRAERARHLTEPYGWFSVVALQWLKPGLTTVGSAPDSTLVLPGTPGHLLTLELTKSQAASKVTVSTADPSVLLAGRPVPTGTVLASDEEDASALTAGKLRFWDINREGQHYLRVKNSAAPARLHFHGLRWYAPNPHLRITARWTPYTTPHTLTTHNQIGQTYTMPSAGYAEFDLDGARRTLIPFAVEDGKLFWVFRDTTSRTTTYPAARFLYTALPSAGLDHPGTVELDFNRAQNPPCAYTAYATCPLAAPENRLPIPIPAGEKRYSD